MIFFRILLYAYWQLMIALYGAVGEEKPGTGTRTTTVLTL
jgi:hypothetical protein